MVEGREIVDLASKLETKRKKKNKRKKESEEIEKEEEGRWRRLIYCLTVIRRSQGNH